MVRIPKKQTWAEMTTAQRVGVIVGGLIQIALLIAAQRDIKRRPADQIRGSKQVWRAASMINFVGPISYFLFGRKPTEAA